MKQTIIISGSLLTGYLLGVVATHEVTKRQLNKILEDGTIRRMMAEASEKVLKERQVAAAGRN